MTGIDMLSADNATNSLPNRVAYPITVNTKSYEKWIKAYVDTAPANQVANFLLWRTIAVQASTHYYLGSTVTGVTPTSADSGIATNDWSTYSTATKFAWHATALTGGGSKTVYAVWQLDVDSDASPGNWTQQTLNYSYDET